MNKNRSKATWLLAFFAGLFFASIPYGHTLLGGLLMSASSAALVGGIADWFAVTAIFRRPLGISFRTEIIPRNRERIFNDLIDMMENTLLTKEHLKAKLYQKDFSQLVLCYISTDAGKDSLKSFLDQIIINSKSLFKRNEAAYFLEKILSKQLKAMKASTILAIVLKWLIAKEYDRKIFQLILQKLVFLCQSEQLTAFITKMIEGTKAKYSKGHGGRKFLLDLFESGELSTEELSKKLQDELGHLIQKASLPESDFWMMIRLILEDFIQKLEKDSLTQQKIELVKENVIGQIPLRHIIDQMLEQLMNNIEEEQFNNWLGNKAFYQIEQLIYNMNDNEQKKMQFNQTLKAIVAEFIDRYHSQLGKMAKNNLAKYTNYTLVEFIETKIGDDLQMIRINGSLVGGGLGAFFYVVHKVFQ